MANPIPEGYELLTGRGRDNALAALKAAEKRGLDPQSVLTVQDGYLVPISEEDRKADSAKKTETASKKAPARGAEDKGE